jgi:uncharacterized protein with PIN domain
VRCEECGKVYWKGSHYGRIREKIGAIINSADMQGMKEEIED